MDILMLDDEIYLSQKVATKIDEVGYHCDLYSSIDDITKTYDTILLSTSLKNVNYLDFIKKHKDATIILLAPFLSDDTVTAPILAGASDYVVKPFSMDELIRKIDHYKSYKRLEAQNEFLLKQLKSSNLKYSFPLIISSRDIIEANKIAFDISLKENKELITITLTKNEEFNYDYGLNNNKILYFNGLEKLDDENKSKFFETMKNNNIIVYQEQMITIDGFSNIELKQKKNLFTQNDIMSINDYVKYIIVNFQDKFPDTKLSEMLGISRKSLWEKRKKLGVEKKK